MEVERYIHIILRQYYRLSTYSLPMGGGKGGIAASIPFKLMPYNKKEVFMPEKPSEKEEEYFARMEYERRKKAEEEKQKVIAKEEKKRLKELHHMKCPKCGMQLIEIDYRETKIDKCSECEGIWLDAGELEAVSRLEKKGLDKLFGVFKR